MEQGLRDVTEGKTTVPAALVVIAFPKLSRVGLISEDAKLPFQDGELTLYRLLRQQEGDAYSKYSALLRELVSFERCL